MKHLFILLLTLLNFSFAQSLEPGQLWQISEGENTWVINITEKIADEFYNAQLVTGDIPADHDLFISVDATEGKTTFTFMFNFLLATDSGSGFKCSVSETSEGVLERYFGSVAGPQWEEETETCTATLQQVN